ncbi:MAG: nuclease-related domain-containing protein [Patescibacteria group bacterium]|jgi:hypothetical protein
MAIMHGKASKYLIRLDKMYRVAAYTLLVFTIGSALFGFLKNFKINTTIVGLIVLIILWAPLFWLVLRMYKKYLSESDKYHRGRKGEGAIWYELQKLNNQYHVYQDAVIKGNQWNIDFIVLGPKGLFVVEVKSHTGNITYANNTLLLNGKPFEKDFLSQIKKQETGLSKFLKSQLGKDIKIQPVIVFSHKWATMHFGMNPVSNSGVYVVQKRLLNKLINSAQQVFSLNDISKIGEQLEKLVV